MAFAMACHGIKLHELLQDTHELWTKDRPSSQSKQWPKWHTDMKSLKSSSKYCHLCESILQALEYDLQTSVDELVKSGDMPESNRSDYAGGLQKISKYAKYLFDVSLCYDPEVPGQTPRAYFNITLKPDPPRYSSWDPGDVKVSFRIVASHASIEAQDMLACQIDVNPASDQTFSQIGMWLDACTKDHEKCPKGKDDAPLPTRILDVGDLSSKMVYLRELATMSEKSAPYIALSHCWGVEQATEKLTRDTKNPVDLSQSSSVLDAYWEVRKASQTTTETLVEKLQGVPIEALPQTAQDAIIIARKIGISYLWIDSLCIIQDDKEDWLRESARMADIYLNAFLVVGASNSSADYDGFLHERPEPDMVKFNHTLSDGTNTYLGLQLLPPTSRRWAMINSPETSNMDPLGDEPLTHRAWCLQERYLARRMVLYGSAQVFWECAELLAAQDGDSVVRADDYLQELKATASVKPTIFEPRPDGDDMVNYRAWYKMVEKYMSCAITQGTDRLPALAGLASAVASSSHDEYLAGIWRNGMIEGLLWSKAESGKSSLKRPDTYRAPSWSWVSVEGKVQFTVYNFFQRCLWKRGIADYEALAKCVDYGITTDGENIYGGVKSGYLRITAPLLRVFCMQVSQPNPISDIMVPFTSLACDRVFGLSVGPNEMYLEGGFDVEEYDSNNISVLLLARLPDGGNGFDPFIDIRFGIIVNPTDQEGVYRRVGIIDGPVLARRYPQEPTTTEMAAIESPDKEVGGRWVCELFAPDHTLYDGDDGPEEMPSDPLPNFRKEEYMATVTLI
ncbi:hypothetical protein B7463_g5190, partial [Scytalidium lignicola]